VSTDVVEAMNASIGELEAKKLSVESADLKYANIGFANIDKAAIETFFAKSGVSEDWTSENGTVTGKLVAVSINADNITAGSLLAERIMLQGDDGLFYKLNVDAMGETTASALPQDEQEKLKNGIHGKSIIAETITADKISVSDLNAFGATIGGFKIDHNAIHAVVKDSAGNTTRGIYMDNDGQLVVGDETNFLKYYYDEENGEYKLEISASSIVLGSTNKTIEETVEDVLDRVDVGARNLIRNSKTLIFGDYYFVADSNLIGTGTLGAMILRKED
jgi:hypothetical protein